MNGNVKITRKITMELEEKEARWLKAYLQNPRCEPCDESLEDAVNREVFFNFLKDNLES
jgi:hypothetical protein